MQHITCTFASTSQLSPTSPVLNQSNKSHESLIVTYKIDDVPIRVYGCLANDDIENDD